MMLRPQKYETKKRGKFIELRLYICGTRVKSLADRIPSCFGLINELLKKKVNCRAKCSLRDFCRKVSVQFRDDLEMIKNG